MNLLASVIVATLLFWAAVVCALLGDWRSCVGCVAGMCGCLLAGWLDDEDDDVVEGGAWARLDDTYDLVNAA